jgi:hypothetical protein
MKTNFDKEFEEFQNDKKEINESLELEKEKYAETIKYSLGENIKEELSNPSVKTIKHSRKYKLKQWWSHLKIKLNNYFFN